MALEKAFSPTTNKGKAIKELQGLTTSVVAGAAAATNIAVAGITVADTIQSVVQFTGGVPSVVTADAAITSDGNIQLATVVSTGNTLLVNWFNKK